LRSVEAEQDDWSSLATAEARDEFCRGWLGLQARMIIQLHGVDVIAGIVLLGPVDTGPYTPCAVWPDRQVDVTYLSGAAEQALRERRGLVVPAGEGQGASSHVAYPLEVSGHIHGVVALDVAGNSDEQLQAALRALHWGTGRLETMLAQDDAARALDIINRLVLNLDLVAVAGEQPEFLSACRSLVTELASRLECDRVSVGFLEGEHVEVRAISHSADFKEKANLVRAIGAAMDESVEQQQLIVAPERPDAPVLVMRAAIDLLELNGGGSVCVLPLADSAGRVGALALESSREDRFDQQTIELCEAVAALVGPILQLQRSNARPLWRRLRDAGSELLGKFIGRGHLAWKLVGVAVVTLFAVLVFVPGQYRVTADAVLEGRVLRAAVAPFDGYIETAEVRAGDLVSEGALICTLDDKDLAVERQKVLSRRQQLSKQLREAEAGREWAQAGILTAQNAQAEAELTLIEDKLARTRLIAPFDGVVVSGDLSQSLGAPVKRGDVLFEIAPLDEYRVVLKVDERDIEGLEIGQPGLLTLSSMPGDELALVIESITPVTTAEDGRNFFRVEAALGGEGARLRPGMEGVAKVNIDERRLLWIWTHRIVDWLRLWFWTWWP